MKRRPDRPAVMRVGFLLLVLLALAGVAPPPALPAGDRGSDDAVRRRIGSLKDIVRHHDAPDSLRYQLALAYLDAGTIEDKIHAAELFETIRRTYEREPRYHWARARMYEDCQQPSSALGCLREVVKLDPEDVEAHIEMARLHLRELLYHFDLKLTDSMQEALEKALALKPEHREALFLMALTLELADQRPERASPAATGRAMKCLEQILNKDPEDVAARLLLAVHCLDSGRAEDAEHHFDLALASGPEDLREGFASCRWTASDHVLDQASGYSGAQLALYDRSYWQHYDPTPLTLLNENQLETWKRLVLADLLFARPEEGLRGWRTPPGEAFVRYGVPASNDFDPGEVSVEHGVDEDLGRSYLGESYANSKPVLKLVPPAWSWDYRFHGLDFSLRFQDDNLNGTFRADDPTVARLQVLRRSTPAVFQEAPPGRIRHVYVASSGQAGAGSRTRQTVNLGLPLWRGTKDRAWLEKVRVVIDVKDSTRSPVKMSRRLGSAGGIVPMLGDRVDVLIVNDTFDLLPGRYTVTALIDDDDGKAHGSLTCPIEVKDFHAEKGLRLSDVELALASSDSSSRAVVSRYGRDYVSDPLAVPGNERDLDAFYELYGLAVKDSVSEHQTRYTVLPRQYVLAYERLVREGKVDAQDLVDFAAREMARGGRNLSPANYVDVTFPGAILPVTNGRAPKGTRVVVSKLDPGEYALILTVTDAISGETASARTFFRILNDEQVNELVAYSGGKP